jgi:hypothetical protein
MEMSSDRSFCSSSTGRFVRVVDQARMEGRTKMEDEGQKDTYVTDVAGMSQRFVSRQSGMTGHTKVTRTDGLPENRSLLETLHPESERTRTSVSLVPVSVPVRNIRVRTPISYR